MKKVNWKSFEKNAKTLKRNVNVLKQAGEFLKEFPEKGYMRDNISKNLIEIKTAKSSSLRRYIKLLDNFYYLVGSETDKAQILNKKIEIETELNLREDSLPKGNE